MFNKFLTALPL